MGPKLGFFVARWLSKQPFRLLYCFSGFLSFLLRLVVRYRKGVVVQNLKLTFPNESQAFYSRTRKGFYRNFSDFLVESVKVQSGNGSDITSRVRLKNPGVLRALYMQKKHVMLLSGHLFNWEWYVALAAQTDFETHAVYKRLKNEFLDDAFRAIRSRYHTRVFPMEDTYKHMIQAVKGKPALFLFLADQSPHFSKITHDLDFLGVRTPVFTGWDKMARKLGMAVVYTAMKRCKRGEYEIEFQPITENAGLEAPHFIVNQFYQALAESIRRAPDNYLWSHKRWKYRFGEHYGLNV